MLVPWEPMAVLCRTWATWDEEDLESGQANPKEAPGEKTKAAFEAYIDPANCSAPSAGMFIGSICM